jgi:hypothetical protein
MDYPHTGMIDFLKLLGGSLGLFRSHAAREAETAFPRQQLLVLKRSAPARLRLRKADRLIFVWLYRLFRPEVTERPAGTHKGTGGDQRINTTGTKAQKLAGLYRKRLDVRQPAANLQLTDLV